MLSLLKIGLFRLKQLNDFKRRSSLTFINHPIAKLLHEAAYLTITFLLEYLLCLC